MNIVKSSAALLGDMRFYMQFWGIGNASRIRLFPTLRRVLHLQTVGYEDFNIINSLLRRELRPIIEKYKGETHTPPSVIAGDAPVWVCWWQGEGQMPEMIGQCYKLLKKNRNCHPVHLITKDSYREYIQLPEVVLKRLHAKEITFTFLSDVLRVSLLAKYGGIWLDATYWVTRPLDFGQARFFSIRQTRFKGGIANFRWTPHCLGAGSPYYVFDFIRESFICHLTLHKSIVTYLLIDQVINIAYEEFPDFRQLVDNLPDTEPHIYIMPWLFNQELNEKTLYEVLNTTPLLKLTYKQEYVRKTDAGKKTFYDYFVNL
jgi:hypothetical protein